MARPSEVQYRGRRAIRLEDQSLRVTVTVEGGHIAEVLHKPTGINPLWTPVWPSIEPSTYDPAKHNYGTGPEAKLLSGIMGHNLCLDLFGAPSKEEEARGMTLHGEASVLAYEFDYDEANRKLIAKTRLPLASLAFERSLTLRPNGVVELNEAVTNLSGIDRPLVWTQHVTLGPPFLENGRTEFRASATRSRTYESEFGNVFPIATTFDWPMAPRAKGGTYDLRVYNKDASSGGFTTHLMDPHRRDAFFVAWHPDSKLAFGYKWIRADFPWLGMWEENRFRENAPWGGKSITRGMEFGASPYPESRRQNIERKELFGVPVYRWLPAAGTLRTTYTIRAFTSDRVPEQL
jgi:hypothetical protein